MDFLGDVFLVSLVSFQIHALFCFGWGVISSLDGMQNSNLLMRRYEKECLKVCHRGAESVDLLNNLWKDFINILDLQFQLHEDVILSADLVVSISFTSVRGRS